MPLDQQSDVADKRDPWLRSFFLTRLSALDADRQSYWHTWREESRMFAPKRGRFFSSGNDATRGRRKDSKIIDNTARLAADKFASAMMEGATSQARPWFRLDFGVPGMKDQDGAREWLDEVGTRMVAVFNRSNFYIALRSLYFEFGCFSNAVMVIDDHENDVIRCRTLTVGEYWLASNDDGDVDTLYRSFWWTARQIVEKFGRDEVSWGVRSLYDSGQLDREVEVIHAIEPNPNALPPDARIPKGSAYPWDGRLARELAFRSVWFERGETGKNMLLRVSGYHEFPGPAMRWDTASTDTYGSDGPGEKCLGDTQQLQVEQRTKTDLTEKLAKPPMKGPPYLENRPASILRGGMTIVAEGQNGKFEPALMVDPRGVQAISEGVAEIKERIQDAWYLPILMAMLTNDREQPDTAREVEEKHDEKMMMIGPLLQRLHKEGLAVIIRRVFNTMARKGLIPPPPEGVDIAALDIEFVSRLALEMKAAGIGVIERVFQFAAANREQFPDLGDNIDSDGSFRNYCEFAGLPAKDLRSEDDRDKLRAQRAKQVEMQQTPEKIKALAEAANAAGNIDLGGGKTAAGALLGGT